MPYRKTIIPLAEFKKKPTWRIVKKWHSDRRDEYKYNSRYGQWRYYIQKRFLFFFWITFKSFDSIHTARNYVDLKTTKEIVWEL